MKVVIEAWPRGMRPEVAAEYVGGETILQKLIARGLKAKRRGHRLTIYDRRDVDAFFDAFEEGAES